MMNDLGLHSGLSEDLKRWADLVDEVLVAIKTGDSLEGNQSYDELRRLVYSILNKDATTADFADLRIGNIIALELGKSFDWTKLGEALEGPDSADDLVNLLDKVARCLSREHSRTIARMRWRHF